jgi:uncharacterized membrane protein YedE/YeeE
MTTVIDRKAVRGERLAWYLVLGCLFGIVLVKSEVVSWYRINEMFRFQSFHMYGILGSAVGVAAMGLAVLRRTGATALTGEAIRVQPKQMGGGYRYWLGGALFGIGWALTGACPGPLFALVGAGSSVFVVVALSAVAGTWTYGLLRQRLPH